MPSVKFSHPVESPPATSPWLAATLGQVTEVVTALTEPAIDLLLILENALI